MAAPDAPAEWHAGELHARLRQARDAVNATLPEMAHPHLAASLESGSLRYRALTPPHRIEAIALADFHSPFRLRLDQLALTLDGYCVARRFGWERREEIILTTRRPPWWRRIAHAAPLLSLTLCAGAALPCFAAASAPRVRRSPGRELVVRFEPDMQRALLRAHRQANAHARTRAQGLWAWLRARAGGATAQSETDI